MLITFRYLTMLKHPYIMGKLHLIMISPLYRFIHICMLNQFVLILLRIFLSMFINEIRLLHYLFLGSPFLVLVSKIHSLYKMN